MSMTNKRIICRCPVKMYKSVQPLQVSPIIKGARWFFLIYGIFYGAFRMKMLKAFEEKEHVIREKLLKQKYDALKLELARQTKEEIMNLGREFEVTEFPPGWDDSL